MNAILSQGLPTHRHVPPAQSSRHEYGDGACSDFGFWAVMLILPLDVRLYLGVWWVVLWGLVE